MAFEATFYTLAHPFPSNVLNRLAQQPGTKVELVAQTDVHEHLCGFLAFLSAIGTELPQDRWTKLSEFIVAVGDVINIEVKEDHAHPEIAIQIRETLSAVATGIWLFADGVFDNDGRKIVGNEGEFDKKSRIPDVPEPRKSFAGFLYGALEQERELIDQNQSPTSAQLTMRPLNECYKMVEHGCRKAERYGFSNPEDQLLFVSVMLEIGPNFDDHPDIKRILQDKKLKPNQRLDACVDHPEAERIWTEVEQIIDHTQWSAASPH